MSKFNTASAKPATFSPITSEPVPSGRTHEGGAGYARDTKSELFMLAVSNMVGESSFYETARERDDRYSRLVQEATLADPHWTARFLTWLRTEANMRSAAVVGAAEFVKARLDAAGSRPARQHETADRTTGQWEGDDLAYSVVTNRSVIDSVLQRADEPGELLAYWMSKYGRTLSMPVKRGVGDAARRLYTEDSLLKWDSTARGFRFGDVIDLVRPTPLDDRQSALFRHAIDRRHGRDTGIPAELETLAIHADLMAWPVDKRRDLFNRDADTVASVLRQAGMTWESVAGWLQGPMTARVWEALIPSMGYMALLRNLRNLNEAGVSDEVAERVAKRLADPEQVAKSKQFPFRFWSAYKHTTSLRWGHALEKALNLSLANVPSLPGRTLVLVDRSPSMFPGYHFSTANRSDITLAEQAAVFGAAVAMRAQDATLVEFGGESRVVPRGGSVLRLIERFGQINGTDIPLAVKRHYRNHDRVVVVTDEQTRPGYLPSNMYGHGGMQETSIDALVPLDVPVYMWNMAGYKPGAMPSGSRNRHAFGGLTDQAFRMVPLLEAGRSASWPF